MKLKDAYWRVAALERWVTYYLSPLSDISFPSRTQYTTNHDEILSRIEIFDDRSSKSNDTQSTPERVL